MKNFKFYLLLFMLFLGICSRLYSQNYKLKVSDNQRYIVHDDGTPIFYLADTGWELFHNLNREEVDLYLNNRAKKGFTAIQAVFLKNTFGKWSGNAYGHLPLNNANPASPKIINGPIMTTGIKWITL